MGNAATVSPFLHQLLFPSSSLMWLWFSLSANWSDCLPIQDILVSRELKGQKSIISISGSVAPHFLDSARFRNTVHWSWKENLHLFQSSRSWPGNLHKAFTVNSSQSLTVSCLTFLINVFCQTHKSSPSFSKGAPWRLTIVRNNSVIPSALWTSLLCDLQSSSLSKGCTASTQLRKAAEKGCYFSIKFLEAGQHQICVLLIINLEHVACIMNWDGF